MLQRFNLELDCSVESPNGSMYPNSNGDYILYDDVKKLIELNKKLLGSYAYTPNDIQNGVDFYDVKEILQDLETEIIEVFED